MPISMVDLENETWAELGLEQGDTDMPVDRIDLLLNRSWWEIIDKFHFREKETTTSWPTVTGTALYSISPVPFEALRQLSIEDLNDQTHSTIDPITTYIYENQFVNRTDQQDKPRFYVRENTNIRLLPTPDNIYTITMKYWSILQDLANPSATSPHNPEIPQSWHEIILQGAIWRGFKRLGDYARAQQAFQYQRSLIESAVPVEAKEEFDRHRAGLNVLWDDPRSGHDRDPDTGDTLLPGQGSWNRF